MSVLITTPVANFTIDHLASRFAAGKFPIESWARSYAKSYPEHQVQYWNSRCTLIFRSGPIITPAIWTHTPVPQGFDIEKLKREFEHRAGAVLSDYEEPTNFAPDPSYPDGRYKDTNVRAAWMMYVDLAVQTYLAKLH